MNQKIITVLLTCFMALASVQADDSLWDRSIEIGSANRQWMPGRVHEDERSYDQKGALVDSVQREYSLEADKDGIEIELVSACSNGKDVTSRERRRFDPEGTLLFLTSLAVNPHDELMKSGLFAHKRPGSERIGEDDCEVYDFKYEREDGCWSGVSWIEKERGVPVRVEYTSEGVTGLDGLEILKLEGRIDFHVSEECWYPLSISYVMDLEYKSFLSEFRGRVVSEVSFDAYFSL